MTRTDSRRYEGDTWDLASSVGATATLVAAARAAASRGERPLIDDPFAEPLVQAVGVDLFTRLATGQLRPEDFGDEAGAGMRRMADNMAVRTRFFDQFFLDAAAAGIRQAVILASGLDARAYRLPWPAGTTVYEIDQPEVIEFKSRSLSELGAQPTAERRAVAIDLRYDWPTALKAAGFDTTVPTAWSAEGLLGYLPPDAQDRLLDTVTALSAPGSRTAMESMPKIDPAELDRLAARMQSVVSQWRDHGLDLDMTNLVYLGDRNDVGQYLTDHGWRTTSVTAGELLAANGLPPLDTDDIPFAGMTYLSGTLDEKPKDGGDR